MENEKKLKFNPDDMIAAADEQFLEWMKNGRYAELIDTMPNLGRYSLRNQMLILMQNPKATCVNGMNAWNYKRRHIEKGQTSIRIIAPKFASQVSTDKDGNITEKTLDTITGYEVNFVYDVSQTAGEPVKDVFADSTAVDRYDTVAVAITGAAKGFEFKTHEKPRTKATEFWIRSTRRSPSVPTSPKRTLCACSCSRSRRRTCSCATGGIFRVSRPRTWRISTPLKRAQSRIPSASG